MSIKKNLDLLLLNKNYYKNMNKWKAVNYAASLFWAVWLTLTPACAIINLIQKVLLNLF